VPASSDEAASSRFRAPCRADRTAGRTDPVGGVSRAQSRSFPWRMVHGMNFSFNIRDESGYLNVDLSGEWNLDELKGFAEALHLRVKDGGHRKILIDAMRTTTPPDTSSSYFYGDYISTKFFGFKIALVIRKEFISGLFENVAVNRGVFLSVFHDKPSALQWLLSANLEKE
jgi:hypothetical protein